MKPSNYENTVEKAETTFISCNKLFLLSSQGFPCVLTLYQKNPGFHMSAA